MQEIVSFNQTTRKGRIITLARSSIITFINCEKKTRKLFSSMPLAFSIDMQPRLITLRFLSTNKPFADTQSVL